MYVSLLIRERGRALNRPIATTQWRNTSNSPELLYHLLTSMSRIGECTAPLDLATKIKQIFSRNPSLTAIPSAIYTLRANAVQCIVIGPVCLCMCLCVCLFVCGSVATITRNCVHRSSPNWVCR